MEHADHCAGGRARRIDRRVAASPERTESVHGRATLDVRRWCSIGLRITDGRNGVVVALGGYRGASFAVRAGGRGDVTATHRLWHKPEDIGWLGTGVIYDGTVYICDTGGVIYCIDAQTGDILWKRRSDGGGTWSSITQTADGTMYLLTKSGTTTVFRPDREALKRVATNELNEASNASVVVAGNNVLVRTDQALWCFETPEQN